MQQPSWQCSGKRANNFAYHRLISAVIWLPHVCIKCVYVCMNVRSFDSMEIYFSTRTRNEMNTQTAKQKQWMCYVFVFVFVCACLHVYVYSMSMYIPFEVVLWAPPHSLQFEFELSCVLVFNARRNTYIPAIFEACKSIVVFICLRVSVWVYVHLLYTNKMRVCFIVKVCTVVWLKRLIEKKKKEAAAITLL